MPGTATARAERKYGARMASVDEPQGDEATYLEPRWPIAVVLLFFIALTIALRVAQPHAEALGNRWVVPGIEMALFVALLASDPLRLDRRSLWARRIALVLVLMSVVVALVSTTVLVADLIRGGKVTQSATSLRNSST